jgi:hypothetical protein
MAPKIRSHFNGADSTYYGGQKILATSKTICKPYFIVIMITVLIMIGIFWVVNFKTRNYFVILYYTDVYLRLSMYCCGQIKLGSNFFYCNKKLFFKLPHPSVMLCHRYGWLEKKTGTVSKSSVKFY